MTATPPAQNTRASNERFLAALRLLLCAWLVVTPFVAGHFSGPLGYNDVACGVAALAVVLFSLRFPMVRFALVPIAVWVGASPFVLDGAGPASYFHEVIVAKLLLFTTVASAEVFEQ